VINHERPNYVTDWAEFVFLPGAIEALRQLASLDRPILVLTNQSAIGRGLVSAATVAAIHQRMIALVAEAGGRIDAVFVCPHHPDAGCECRKPQPGLFQQAAEAFDLRLQDCYFIGDALSDLWAARAAGCWPILVRSGLQRERLDAVPEDLADVPLLDDLAQATELILSRQRRIR
jgi:D-glycero-D-manno-heptose 1,7-bisphosphate phosphatase